MMEQEVQNRFRTLQQEAVHSYEDDLKRRRQHSAWLAKWQKRWERELSISRPKPANPAAAKRFAQAAAKANSELTAFLRKQRAKLPRPVPPPPKDAMVAVDHPALHLPERIAVPVYASTLLAPDAKDLAGNPGQRGNPWVFPSSPQFARIKNQETGKDSGCEAQVPALETTAVFWFSFYPGKTANWNFLVLADLHGYYDLFANLWIHLFPKPDAAWSFLLWPWGALCVHSRVYVKALVDVYQHGWRGTKQFNLLDLDTKTGQLMQTFDEIGQYDHQAPLVANDLTFVKFTIAIKAIARGKYSSAEINFADNFGFLWTKLLIAWPG